MSRTHSLDQLSDADRLRQLGYTPSLSRGMSRFGNFAISFSVISVLSGCMTLYAFGLTAGGPSVIIWGWMLVGAMTMLVGAALAEVTSAFPVAGALYYMADRLGGRRWGWYTGVLNLLGLLSGIAVVDFGCATFVGAFVYLEWGVQPTQSAMIGIFAVLLALHTVLNLLGVRLVSLLNAVSVWWHLAGVTLIVVALWALPARHQSTTFVFTHFANTTGWHSSAYVAFLGLLVAQYTFGGYDASAHLAEETEQAQVNAPRGIVRSIAVSWAAGLVLLVGLTYAIQDYTSTRAAAVPPERIFLDALGASGAKLLLLVVIVAQFFCGNARLAACARMVWAFSRDGAVPGGVLWTRLSANKSPYAAVIFSALVAFVLALPVLGSPVAYGAVTAVAVVGTTTAYALPLYLRLRTGRDFQVGPWSLGRFSRPIGVTAIAWLAVTTVVACLPQVSPTTVQNVQYAPVALLVTLLLATLWWPIARRRYATPQLHTSAQLDELLAEVI